MLDPLVIKKWRLNGSLWIMILLFWHDDNFNVVNMSTLSATGYRFLHNARAVWRGRGVGVLFKDTVRINNIICDTRETFELVDVRCRSSVRHQFAT